MAIRRRTTVRLLLLGVLVAAILGARFGGSTPAATGTFSLDRLRLDSTTGSEDYLFTAGNTVVPDGGIATGAYYKVVVTDASGTVRNAGFPCTAASAFTSTANGYTIAAGDPVSTNTAWRLTLQQFARSDCSGTPSPTASKSFWVAKATSYADAVLTTKKAVFAAGGTAYLTVAGAKPGTGAWSVTWLTPSSATACANTAGSDRPDSNSSGLLPKQGGSFLQYRPNTTSTGSAWNRESNYETRPCPSLGAANEGAWRLRIQKDATTFVVLSAFGVDATAPDTSIGSSPPALSSSGAASFAFTATETGASFQCDLDGGGYAACTSPKAYSGLADGSHTFRVRAIDAAGNVDATPASFTWTVDTTAPAVTLTAPAGGSSGNDATPTFAGAAGSAAGDSTTVTVSVYPGTTATGTPTQVLTATRSGSAWTVDAAALADGTYTARAAQQDLAGNTGSSTPSTFTVDTAAPQTTITGKPADPSTVADASFDFTSSDAGSSFSCRLDGGDPAPCTSPKAYTGLANGSHTFSVAATDPAGNTDATPAAYTWTVNAATDTTPPVVTLVSPAAGSSTSDSTPTFSGQAGTAASDSSTVVVKVYAGSLPSGTPAETLTATRDGSGAYAVDASPALALGTYVAQAEQSDAAGNLGSSTANGFSVVAAPTSYRSEVLADSPSAYWRLGEAAGTTTAYDETGLNNGTYNNGVTLGQPGALNDPNTSASFDGVNDSVGVPDSASLDETTAVTIEAWVQRAKGSAWQVVAGKPANGQSQYENYSIWLNSSNQPIAFFGNGTSFVRVDGPAIDTAWHHIAATYDNATARMYIDGVLKASVSSTVKLGANTQPLLIGRDSGSTYFFGGRIDEVAVYPTALTATRIQAHFQAASVETGSPDVTPPTVVLTTPGNGSQTSDTTPTVAGTAGSAAGDSSTVTVKVYSGTTVAGTPVASVTATRGTNDAFSAELLTPLAEGTYTAQAEQQDDAGNVGHSSANTFTVVFASGGDPELIGAGDIAYCGSNGDEATAALLGLHPSATVFTLGDNAYEYGTPTEFAQCYDPSWGQYKSRTRPALGDHDYADGSDPDATGYFGYFGTQLAQFGASATDPNRGWYSYDIGAWHVVVANSECDLARTPCSFTDEANWIRSDMAAHPAMCTLAIVPAPRFSSGSIHGNNTAMDPFWQAIYDNGGDIVLSGDDHDYERFAPQTPAGVYDPVRGIREFVVGTGGRSHYAFSNQIDANSEVRNDSTYGVLKLTLHATSYDWQFIPEAGATFTDSGNQACH